MTAGGLIARFGHVRRNRKGWTARCPAHDDHENSLSLAIGDDGRLLLNCFAGCRPQPIVAAAGLQMRDLFAASAPVAASTRPRAMSALEEARRDILREARRQRARRDVEGYADADTVRAGRRGVLLARAHATGLGDCDAAWDLLDAAAALERGVLAIEARLDGAA
jgi:hypothetical protein